MLKALEGLSKADLVHGDCKPSNFLVSDKDEIILTDFGTCRERNAPADDAAVVGTPRFASSTALRGEAPSPSDDLEACAYALAYLLTGRLPFAADYDDRTTLKASSDSALADAKDAVAPDLLCASSRKGEADFDAASSCVCVPRSCARRGWPGVKVGTRTTPRSYLPFLMSSRTGARRACPGTTPGRSIWRTMARNLFFCVFVFAVRHRSRVHRTPAGPRPSFRRRPARRRRAGASKSEHAAQPSYGCT